MKRDPTISLRMYLITITLVAILCISITGYVFSSNSEIPIEKDSFIKGASFIIENDDGVYKAFNGQTGALAYNGSDVSTVINNTLAGLTSGRTWKEKVVFKGILEVDYNVVEILIPNYTVLDFEGSLIKVKDGVEELEWVGIFRNKDIPATEIEIRNMKFDENSANAPDGYAEIFWFEDVSNLTIHNCDLRSPDLGYKLYLEGSYPNLRITEVKYDGFTLNINVDNGFFESCLFEKHVNLYGSSNTFLNNRIIDANLALLDGNFHIISHNHMKQLSLCRCNDSIISENVIVGSLLSIVIDDCSRTKIMKNSLNSVLGGYAVEVVRTFGVAIDNEIVGNTIVEAEIYSIWIEDSECVNTTIQFNIVNKPIDDHGTGTVIRFNEGFVTENSGTAEASNDDWIVHGLVGEPTYVDLTIEEIDANYFLQLKATNATHFQIYLYDATASELETTDKTINWYVEYQP